MSHLTNFDYVLIVGYFVLLVGVGFYLRKKASASLDDYFLGGRKLPWWALGISGMAAWLDLTGTMLITSFLFLVGPTGLFVEFRGGACLVLVFLFVFVGKWHRRSGVMTSAEWMVFRFGRGFWGSFAQLTQVLAITVMSVGMLAYSIKGVGLFLSMFLPFTPTVCAAIMVGLTCIYLIQSGFYGVVVTDVIQSAFILIGVIFIVVFTVMKIHGADLSAVALEATGNPQWLRSLPTWRAEMPKGYENYNYLQLVVIFFLLKSVFQGLGIFVDNRYFGAAGERECGLVGFTSGVAMTIRWPMMMGIAILGLFLVTETFPDQDVIVQASQAIHAHFEETTGPMSANLWHEELANIINRPQDYGNLPSTLSTLLGDQWEAKVALVSYHGTIFPERILPAVLLGMIPTGFKGILIVALMAAAMSTFNTMINMTTSLLTRDLYQGYIRPKAKTAELIYMSWGFGILLFIAGFAMAFYAPDINNIWGWLTGGLAAGLGVSSILRLYWWRFNGGGFSIGLVVGLLAAVVQRIFMPGMYEWYQFMYILVVGLVACIVGTYLTEPTDRDVLENFYRKTRPFGLWKPLQSILDERTLKSTKKEHLCDIIAIPFGYTWLVSMISMPIQAMALNWKAFSIWCVVFLISLAGLYVFWYRQLPPPAPKISNDFHGEADKIKEVIHEL